MSPCKALISALKTIVAVGSVLLIVVIVIALALLSLSWVADCLELAWP